MFKLEKERTFTWPVKIKVPTDGGVFADAGFDCKFKLVSQDEIDDFVAGKVSERDFLKANIVGWTGVQDDQDRELPFSEAARDSMIGIPYVRVALMGAYLEAMSGARRKN